MKIRKQKNKKIINNTCNTKGITLIALVVTIIILIILAGVSINLLLGENGIVGKTIYAKQQYEMAQVKEKLDLAITEIQTEEASKGREATLDTLYTNLPTKLSGISIEKEENELKGILNNYEFSINKNLRATVIGLYTPITINDLKAGDYIKYDTGVTSVGEKGVIMCRVLYEANSQYGLQIISDKNVTEIKLGEDSIGGTTGKEKYNSAIETLNKRAEDYLNLTYAVDARCVGSVPTVDLKGKMVDKNSETTEDETLKFTPIGGTADSDCRGLDYNYYEDLGQMKKIGDNGIHITEQEYWLASRDVESYDEHCEFNIRYINNIGEPSGNNLVGIYLDGLTYSFSDTSGLRPCFSLRTDIEITEGDGKTVESAYIIK